MDEGQKNVIVEQEERLQANQITLLLYQTVKLYQPADHDRGAAGRFPPGCQRRCSFASTTTEAIPAFPS